MSTRMTPPFGVTGLWRLKSPFVAKPAKQYTCSAIRSFTELRLMSIDVYDYCYKEKELPTSAYEEDLKAGASIVVLIGTDGERIYVPDTYIESYPDLNIGNFKRFILSCEVGVLPAETKLDHLATEIQSQVSKKLGRTVRVETYIGDINPESLNPTELKREENNRIANIQDRTTVHGKLYEANRRIGDMQGYIQVLEKRAKQNDISEHELNTTRERNKTLEAEATTLRTNNQELTDQNNTLNDTVTTQTARIALLEKTIRELGGRVPD